MKHARIKAASVFAVDLPSFAVLTGHLEEHPHKEPGALDLRTVGMVPHPITKELVSPIEGGYVITMQIDEKILPASIVNRATAKKAKEIEDNEGRPVRRKERRAISEDIMQTLLPKALVKTSIIYGYYSQAKGHLIVDSSNKNTPELMINLLRMAMGSLKAHSIDVDNLKKGLSTRLESWLHDDSATNDVFGNFEIGAYCKMSRNTDGGKESITIHGGDLSRLKHDLTDCLQWQYNVETLLMSIAGIEFKLTDLFHLKGITYEDDLFDDQDHDQDAISNFRHETAIQLLQITHALDELCEMFEYKEPEK